MKRTLILFAAVYTIFLFMAPVLVMAQEKAGEAPAEAAPPKSEAQRMYDLGKFEMDTANYADALELFDKAIALEPTSANFQFARGQALFKLGRFKEAVAQFERLLDVSDKARYAAYVELGAVHGHSKQYEKAIEYYTKAIEIDPGRANLYLARGSMYLELKQYDQADADFQKAGQIDTKLGAAVEYHRAMISYKQENYITTKGRLDKALTMNPDEPLAKAVTEFKEIVVKEERARKLWRIVVTAVYINDDNITLEPFRGPGAGQDKQDNIFGIDFTGTYFFVNNRAGYSGLSYTFMTRQYSYYDENDYSGHTLTMFYGRNMDPWYYRVYGSVSKYEHHERDLLNIVSLGGTVARVLEHRDRIELTGIIEEKMKPTGTQEDATHFALSSTYFHVYQLPKVRDELGVIGRIGFQFEGEYPNKNLGPQYNLYELRAGLSFQMPYKIEGDVGLSHAWIYYAANNNRDGGMARTDRRTVLSFKAGRSLGDYCRLDFQYSRTLNDSDIGTGGVDPYEYHRDVYSLFFTTSF